MKQKMVESSVIEKAARAALLDSVFLSGVKLVEKIVVRIKANFDTACWSFSNNAHNIYIGDSIFDKEMVKPETITDAVLRSGYVNSLFMHEFSHGLYTIKDLDKIQAALNVIKCPFGLYNLFEDCWIENKFRLDTGLKFEWLKFESFSVSYDPHDILFGIIQTEGDVTRVFEEVRALAKSPSIKDDVSSLKIKFKFIFDKIIAGESLESATELAIVEISKFHKRILGASKSEDQVVILRDWISVFGAPPESCGYGRNDMPFSIKLRDPDAKEKFDADCIPVYMAGIGSEGADGGKKGKGLNIASIDDFELIEATCIDNQVAKKGDVLDEYAHDVDLELATEVANKFSKFFEEFDRKTYSSDPSSRMSAKRMLVGKNPYRRTEKSSKRVKKIFVIADCSGSMSSTIHNLRTFVSALSLLAFAKKIEGHVAVSGLDYGNVSVHETFKLPMTPSQIERIGASFGGEGLEGTMRENLALLKEADNVLVYTDGNITDHPINKAYFRSRAVSTWGLYVGDYASDSVIKSLDRYFDKSLVRKSLVELIDAILVQI